MKVVNEDTLTLNPVKIEFLSVDPELGRMCKRIIDYCRCRFIESRVNAILETKGATKGTTETMKGTTKRFSVEMVYYCEPEDSPENCLILGSLISIVS